MGYVWVRFVIKVAVQYWIWVWPKNMLAHIPGQISIKLGFSLFILFFSISCLNSVSVFMLSAVLFVFGIESLVHFQQKDFMNSIFCCG